MRLSDASKVAHQWAPCRHSDLFHVSPLDHCVALLGRLCLPKVAMPLCPVARAFLPTWQWRAVIENWGLCFFPLFDGSYEWQELFGVTFKI